jgi:hypothetical protein
MKLTMLIGLAFLMAGFDMEARNLLKNGSFEQGLTNWTRVQGVAVTETNRGAVDGRFAMLTRTDTICRQTFPTVIGRRYCYEFTRGAYGVNPNGIAGLQVGVFGPNTRPGWYVCSDFSLAQPTIPTSWHSTTNFFEADSESTTIEILDITNPMENNSEALADRIVVEDTTELEITRSGSKVVLSWYTSWPGKTNYVILQKTTNVISGTWQQVLGRPTEIGNKSYLTNSVGGQRWFYRIKAF